jgi:uncharacterized membrane protein
MRFQPRNFAAPRGCYWIAGILLFALALRLWELGARSLWFDEAMEYWVATAPLTQLLHAVRIGILDPPLYSFLLHLWMKLGTGETWLRLLSVVASLAGIVGMVVLARRLGGMRTAVAAGLLAAVNPPDIRYAQEVGQYALMLGAVAWNLVALHGLWNEGGRKWVLAWASTAFFVSTSFYAAVLTVGVPFGCALIEAVARRDRPRARRFTAALGLYLAVAAPVLLVVLPDQLSRVLHTRAQLADLETGAEGLAPVWQWLRDLFAFHFTASPYTRVPAWIPILGWFVLFALALRARPRWALWFVATWAVYSVAGWIRVLPFGFRWGLILLPSTMMLAAIGATIGAGTRVLRVIGVVAFAGLVMGGAISLPNRTVRDAIDPNFTMPWPETEDMKLVVEYWHERRSPSQPTYVLYGAAPAIAYYLQRYPDTRTDLPATWYLSCWHEESPPDFCRAEDIYYGRWLRSLRPLEMARLFGKTVTTKPRELWIVASHVYGSESADLVEILKQNGYTMVESIERRDAGAVLLQRN